jgi:hypothetical protein
VIRVGEENSKAMVLVEITDTEIARCMDAQVGISDIIEIEVEMIR